LKAEIVRVEGKLKLSRVSALGGRLVLQEVSLDVA
jgi:hypothetical protein